MNVCYPVQHRPADQPTRLPSEEQLEAERISRQIDQDLLEAKKALDKKKQAVKLLVLEPVGQGSPRSDSQNVSLTLSHSYFQLAFTPAQFHRERNAWRSVIQLNVISSVKHVLDILEHQDDEARAGITLADIRRYRLVLSPLLASEESLRAVYDAGLGHISCSDFSVYVRAGNAWKATTATGGITPLGASASVQKPYSGTASLDLTGIVYASKEYMTELWQRARVALDCVDEFKYGTDDVPGFFLNDVVRIATLDYEPTDEDILRARIRTLGVEEHRLVMEKGMASGSDLYITDVSGSLSMRHTWVPYFSDVQTILFLAPLSFNQMLPEDRRVNRVEDSLTLWKQICQNKLLANASIILFFNKRDVLETTLKAGVQVKTYVPSYGDHPNDVVHVTKYFKEKFHKALKKLSPKPRTFLCYSISAIDARATTAMLRSVHEAILQTQLRNMDIIG
ncbi:G-alpha-domain-containing protein [Fistulina hepatica ATCC 64428]|uniref:G-alpha-domain-containing protein n=1 Tax=Fistulina hepatica ATCC 64428 TaxID=1128425 RepID=A0A0D7AE12_9AGAR|nr:G-alpha-domain-containing protein [Fistulina hepatica ATCC 64428]